jgi:AcrR family transcriptional regulator
METPVRRRGRPRLLDRDVGLDIAARLFWERGYEGTSTADLTKAMGINPPTLYSMFDPTYCNPICRFTKL